MDKAAETTAAHFIICLKAHHDATAEHSLRVARCSVLMAKELRLSETQTECLYLGCLLHDIGKIGVSDTLLNKEARLTEIEYAAVQAHTWKGAAMIDDFFRGSVIRVASEHHENFDGTGYPNGFKGNDISMLARICAVLDTFDAITNDRPYRRGDSYETALHEIVSWGGRQFDPDVVEVFRRVPRDRWVTAAQQSYRELIAA